MNQSSSHYYDNCNGGICLKCDQCRIEECCPQTDECLGTNWDFTETIAYVIQRKKERGEIS